MRRPIFGFPGLWMNQVVLWAGAGVLVGTSVINLRLKRGCSRCAVPTGEGTSP